MATRCSGVIARSSSISAASAAAYPLKRRIVFSITQFYRSRNEHAALDFGDTGPQTGIVTQSMLRQPGLYRAGDTSKRHSLR